MFIEPLIILKKFYIKYSITHTHTRNFSYFFLLKTNHLILLKNAHYLQGIFISLNLLHNFSHKFRFILFLLLIIIASKCILTIMIYAIIIICNPFYVWNCIIKYTCVCSNSSEMTKIKYGYLILY